MGRWRPRWIAGLVLLWRCAGADIDRGSALDLVCSAPSVRADAEARTIVRVPHKEGVIVWADARSCKAGMQLLVKTECAGETAQKDVNVCKHEASAPLLADCTSAAGEGRVYILPHAGNVSVITLTLAGEYKCTAACSQGEYPKPRAETDRPPYRCTRCHIVTEDDLNKKSREVAAGSSPNSVVYAACDRTSTAGTIFRECSSNEPWVGKQRALASAADCDRDRGCPSSTWPQYRQAADRTCRLCPYNLSHGAIPGHTFADVCACPPGRHVQGERCEFCPIGQYRTADMRACEPCDTPGPVPALGAVSCTPACARGSARLGGPTHPCQRCPASVSEVYTRIAQGVLAWGPGKNTTHALRARACDNATGDGVTDAAFFLEEARACLAHERLVAATGQCLACAGGAGERFDAASEQCVPRACALGAWNDSTASCVLPPEFEVAAREIEGFQYPVYNASTASFAAAACVVVGAHAEAATASVTACAYNTSTGDFAAVPCVLGAAAASAAGVVNALDLTAAWARRRTVPPVCVLTCGAGYAPTVPGQGGCTPCAPGSAKTGPGHGACTPCPPGTQSAQWEQSRACSECPAGTFSTLGQHACTPCLTSSTAGHSFWRPTMLRRPTDGAPGTNSLAAAVRANPLAPVAPGTGARVVWVEGWGFEADHAPVCNASRDALAPTCANAGMAAGPNCYRCAYGTAAAWTCRAPPDHGNTPCGPAETRDALTGACAPCANATCPGGDAYLADGLCPPAGCRSCLARRPDASLVVAAADAPRQSAAACTFVCAPGHVARAWVQPLLDHAGAAEQRACVPSDAPDLHCSGALGGYLRVHAASGAVHLRCATDTAAYCGALSSAVPRNVALPTHWFRAAGREAGTEGLDLRALRAALHAQPANATTVVLAHTATGLPLDTRLPPVTIVHDDGGGAWRAMLAGEPICQCLPGFYGVNDTGLLCAPCPAGHTSPGGATSPTACVCAPGYYNNNASGAFPCVPCPAGRGFVCPGGRGGPTRACAPHSDTTAPHASSVAAHCEPAPGFRADGRGGTTPCDDSPAVRNLTTYSAGCTVRACAAGSVAPAPGGTGCACDTRRGFAFDAATGLCQCVPGQFARGGLCVVCVPGAYCPGGGLSVGCPDSRATSPAGATHRENCTCPRGYYEDADTRQCIGCAAQWVCRDNMDFYCGPANQADDILQRATCAAKRLSAPQACPPGAVKDNAARECKNIDHPDYATVRDDGPPYRGALLVNQFDFVRGDSTNYNEIRHAVRSPTTEDDRDKVGRNDWLVPLHTDAGTVFATDDDLRRSGKLRESITIAAGLQIICRRGHVLAARADADSDAVADGFDCVRLPSGAHAADLQPVPSGLAVLGPRGLADPHRLGLAQNATRLLARGAHLQWRPFWRCEGGAPVADILGACFPTCAGALEHREHVVGLVTREARISAPLDATAQYVWGDEVLALERADPRACGAEPHYQIPVDPRDALTRAQWEPLGVPALDPGTCLATPDGATWRPLRWTSDVVWFERMPAADPGEALLDLPGLAAVLAGETPRAVPHAVLAGYGATRHGSVVRDRSGGLWRCVREHHHHVPRHIAAWVDAAGRVFVDLLDLRGTLVRRMSEPAAGVGPDERVLATAGLAAWAFASTVAELPAAVAVTCSRAHAIRLVSCQASLCYDTTVDAGSAAPQFCASPAAVAQHHLNSDSLLVSTHDGALWRLMLTAHAAVAVPRPVLALRAVLGATHGALLGLHAPLESRDFSSHYTASALVRESHRAHRHVCAYRVAHAPAALTVSVERIHAARGEPVEQAWNASIAHSAAQAAMASDLAQRFRMGGLDGTGGAVACVAGAVLSTAVAACSEPVRVLLVCTARGEHLFVAADADFASATLANLTVLGARQLPPGAGGLSVTQRFTPVRGTAPDGSAPANTFEVRGHVALAYTYVSENDAAVLAMEEFDFVCSECGTGRRRGADGRCTCLDGHALVCLPCDSHLCRHQSLTWNATETGCYAPAAVHGNTRAHLLCLPCTGGVACPANTPVACGADRFTAHAAEGCGCPVNTTRMPRVRAFAAEPTRGAVVWPASASASAGCAACDTDGGEICHAGLGPRHSLVCPGATRLAVTATRDSRCPTGTPDCTRTVYTFSCRCRDAHVPTYTQRQSFPAPAPFPAAVYAADWSQSHLAAAGLFHTVEYEVVVDTGCVREEYDGPAEQAEWPLLDDDTVAFFRPAGAPVPCPSATAWDHNEPPPLLNDTLGFIRECKSSCERADGRWLNGTRCVPIPENAYVSPDAVLRACPPGTLPEPTQRETCTPIPADETRYYCAPGFFAAFPAEVAVVAAAAANMREHLHLHPFTRHDHSAAESLLALLDTACLGAVWEAIGDGAAQRTQYIHGQEECRHKYALTRANVTATLDLGDDREWQAAPVCVPCLLPFLQCPGQTDRPVLALPVDVAVFGAVQRRPCPPTRPGPFQPAAGLHLASCFREGALVEILPELPPLARYPWPMAILIDATTGVSPTLTQVLNDAANARRLLYMAPNPPPQAVRLPRGTQYLVVGSIDIARVLADQHQHGPVAATPSVVEELLRVPRAWHAAVLPALASDPTARPLLVPGGLLRNPATARLVASALGSLAGTTSVAFLADDTAVRTALGDGAYLMHTPACRADEQCPVLVSALGLQVPLDPTAMPTEPVPAPGLALAPRAACPLDFEASRVGSAYTCSMCVSECSTCANTTAASAPRTCSAAYAHLDAWPTRMPDFVCRADGSLSCA